MNNTELDALAMKRFERAGSGWGRLQFHAHVARQRLMAGWLAAGAAVLKRALDISVSFTSLVITAPFFLLIAILVKIEDGGPVFFPQIRVGRYGSEFKMYKFRSMCLDAEERLKELLSKNQHGEGITFKLKHDPRVTRVGRWLRKCSLDELPQLYNVLKGEMSLVGPRPPLPREVARYTLKHRRRLAVKPGVTCFWQIGGRANIDFSGQVELDVDYIENQCLWTDVKILARTVPAVVSGKGAC